MSAIDEILFPVLLFIVYLWFALQFLTVESVAIDKPATVKTDLINLKHSQSGMSREWLETQSLTNLRAIASELYITPLGDKRLKINWINTIAHTTLTTTVLAIDMCFA